MRFLSCLFCLAFFNSIALAESVTPIEKEEFLEILETAIDAGSMPASCSYEIKKGTFGGFSELNVYASGAEVNVDVTDSYNVLVYTNDTKDGELNALIANEQKRLKLNNVRLVMKAENLTDSSEFRSFSISQEVAKPLNPLKPKELGWVHQSDLVVCK